METAKDAVAGATKDAGNAVGSAAGSAKGPLLAGGAALAGVIGGIALSSARGAQGRKILGIRTPGKPRVQIRSKDLAKTAKEIGSFGEQIGSLASEIRQTRNAVGVGEESRHRSPIEVVLQSLTARR